MQNHLSGQKTSEPVGAVSTINQLVWDTFITFFFKTHTKYASKQHNTSQQFDDI